MTTSPADETPPFTVVDSFQLAPAFTPQPEPAASKTSAAARMRAVGNWARDTGLGITGFIVVLIVALAGWTASFIGLHNFGMNHMGLNVDTAWLVPITFDGAAAGLSLVVFRASINARGASLWRFLIVVFTALSSWINWEHITDPTGRWIAAFMPPAAVILFEGLMSEARAAAARRTGTERPRVHLLRWFMDWSGTWAIYRAYVLGIELPDALRDAAANLAAEPVPSGSTNQPAEPSANPALEVAGTSGEPAPEPAAEPEVQAVREPVKKAPRTTAKRTGRTGSRTSRQQRKQPEPEKPGTSETASPAEQVRQVLNLIEDHGLDAVKLGFVMDQTGMSKTTAYNRLVEARANWSEGQS